MEENWEKEDKPRSVRIHWGCIQHPPSTGIPTAMGLSHQLQKNKIKLKIRGKLGSKRGDSQKRTRLDHGGTFSTFPGEDPHFPRSLAQPTPPLGEEGEQSLLLCSGQQQQKEKSLDSFTPPSASCRGSSGPGGAPGCARARCTSGCPRRQRQCPASASP